MKGLGLIIKPIIIGKCGFGKQNVTENIVKQNV